MEALVSILTPASHDDLMMLREDSVKVGARASRRNVQVQHGTMRCEMRRAGSICARKYLNLSRGDA